MWMVKKMEDGQDWQDAHMGSREIIVGGGWRRGLITRGWHGELCSFCLGFPSMLTQAQGQVTSPFIYVQCSFSYIFSVVYTGIHTEIKLGGG